MLRTALQVFDQPAHPWRSEGVWRPHRSNRVDLDMIHLGCKTPLADPAARGASLLIMTENALRWRHDEFGINDVVDYFRTHDGIAPSLCVLGSTVASEAVDLSLFRSIFVFPESNSSIDLSPALTIEGLLAAFGAVVTIDCTEIIPALNSVRRFGCQLGAVFPKDEIETSDMAHVLLNSFKTFSKLFVRTDDQAFHLMSLGAAQEVICRDIIGQ